MTALRERLVRVIRLPGGSIPLGKYACTPVRHPFLPDENSGTSCLACFGWYDDPRHPAFRMPEATRA